MTKLASLIFIGVTLCSCLRDGTDTGNPGLVNGAPQDSISIIETGNRATDFTAILCFKLGACFQSDTANCQTTINETNDNIDSEIGLTPGDYDNLNEVAQAVDDGDLTASESDYTQCKSDILDLSCSNSLLIDSYQPNQPNPFDEVDKAIPNSCQNLF